MYKSDLERALREFWQVVPPTTEIKEIRRAVDGIVIETLNAEKWKYWYMTATITKLEPWRKTKSDSV